MDLLGPSLEELFELCDRKFTPKTVAIVGKQMVRTWASLALQLLSYHYIAAIITRHP